MISVQRQAVTGADEMRAHMDKTTSIAASKSKFNLTVTVLDMVTRAFDEFGSWWLAEFNAFAPYPLTHLLRGRQKDSITIKFGVGHLDVTKTKGTQTSTQRYSQTAGPSNELTAWVDGQLADRGDASVSLALLPDQAFMRSLVIPVDAKRVLSDILVQDLTSKTPFSPDDVFHGHVVRPLLGDRRRLRVRQAIVRRDFVLNALDRLGITINDLDCLLVSEPMGDVLVPVRYAGIAASTAKWSAEIKAASFGGLLILLAAITVYARQGVAMDRLDADIAAVKPEVQRLEATLRQAALEKKALAALRHRKDGYSAVETLGMLSKALPDDSWLQNVMIEDAARGRRSITITGYSANAAALVSLLDAPGAFEDAAITSAIAMDLVEHRERFMLKAYTAPLHQSEP